TSDSLCVEPGSLTRRSVTVGAVCGGSSTETLADDGDRAATNPLRSSSADQATARYQMRRQPGVTVVSVKINSAPVTFSVTMGGPIVSTLAASSSSLVR